MNYFCKLCLESYYAEDKANGHRLSYSLIAGWACVMCSATVSLGNAVWLAFLPKHNIGSPAVGTWQHPESQKQLLQKMWPHFVPRSILQPKI